MIASGRSPAEIIKEKGLGRLSDDSAIEDACKKAIESKAKAAADFRKGKEGALNALVGDVMRQTKGRADPKLVDRTLRRLLS